MISFVLADIFSDFERFSKYLDSIPDVKQRYQTHIVFADSPTTKVCDYEYILKIEAKNLRTLHRDLQLIRDFDKVERVEPLLVIE